MTVQGTNKKSIENAERISTINLAFYEFYAKKNALLLIIKFYRHKISKFLMCVRFCQARCCNKFHSTSSVSATMQNSHCSRLSSKAFIPRLIQMVKTIGFCSHLGYLIYPVHKSLGWNDRKQSSPKLYLHSAPMLHKQKDTYLIYYLDPWILHGGWWILLMYLKIYNVSHTYRRHKYEMLSLIHI